MWHRFRLNSFKFAPYKSMLYLRGRFHNLHRLLENNEKTVVPIRIQQRFGANQRIGITVST